MSTNIHQTNHSPIKVQSIESTHGTEIGISQQIRFSELGNDQYAEIRVSLDSLRELISALQSELDFLQPPKGSLVNERQGQLFDANDYNR